MKTAEATIEKFVDLFNKHIISIDELSYQFIYDVILAHRAMDSSELAKLLPTEVSQRVREVVADFRANDYQWSPPVVGPAASDAHLAEISQGLREMDRGLAYG